MSKRIEFYFDLGSPTAYLAHTQLKKYAETYGAEIEFKPMLLGAIHKATNNVSPAMVKHKGEYLMQHDMPRFIRRYAVPFKFNRHFPIKTLPLMRGCIAAAELGCLSEYVDLMFRGIWVDGLNLGDLEVIKDTLTKAGLDAEKLLTLADSEEVKQKLKQDTDAALERGIFGAPTMFIGKEMYFGQDRLDFIEAELSA